MSQVSGLETALNGKAASVHSHVISDVTSLQTSLDGKAASSHGHAITDVTGLQTSLSGKAASSHGHAIADITSLQTTLNGKASTSHTHSYSYSLSDVTSGYIKDLGVVTTKNSYVLSYSNLAHVTFIRIKYTKPDAGQTNSFWIGADGGGLEAIAIYASHWDYNGGTDGIITFTKNGWSTGDWKVVEFGADCNEYEYYAWLNAIIMKGVF
jgi:hypothetical protein